nr:zinc finger, CCHC-type [Tanacetum cinerariifolium]
MGDVNPIRSLRDYSKPSHEGYRNTIKLPEGNNIVPLRSDTIRLVQNGFLFHGLRSEDPNQHLKDFLKLVDSLDLDSENKERMRLRLFQFSLRDQASNWLERLPAGSITTWEDLTTRFLDQFFPPRRIAKLHNDILIEEAKSPVTKNVNSISLAIGKEERNNNDDMAADGGINGTDTKMPVKEVEKETEAENGTKSKPIKRAEIEKTTEASSS